MADEDFTVSYTPFLYLYLPAVTCWLAAVKRQRPALSQATRCDCIPSGWCLLLFPELINEWLFPPLGFFEPIPDSSSILQLLRSGTWEASVVRLPMSGTFSFYPHV